MNETGDSKDKGDGKDKSPSAIPATHAAVAGAIAAAVAAVANVIPAILAVIVLLIPCVQCWFLTYQNTQLEREILETREANRELQKVVQRVHEMKTSELVHTGARVNELEDRLARNRKMSKDTAEAQQKLVAVKDLILEHQRLARELDSWKRIFPELFSGQ